MNLSCWEDDETFPRTPARLWWARPGETSKCWIHTPHTDRGVLEQIWSVRTRMMRVYSQGQSSDSSCLRWRTAEGTSRKAALKKAGWRKRTEYFGLRACLGLWATWNSPTEACIRLLRNPSHPLLPGSQISHRPLLHEMNGESENLVPAMLDSGRHRSSCNIWWLGRGVGLELGKLLWHPCPHERQPSTTASTWSFCTTQTDSRRSGWDQESSNGKTPGALGL